MSTTPFPHRLSWAAALCLLVIGLPARAADRAATTLPRPPEPFAGKIAPSNAQSTPAWPKQAQAPKGAPNVVVVLLDDVGFSAPSTFGGVADTPTLQALADKGVSYNQFHVTSLCAPTRAAILTGRNHHEAGFGVVGNAGYPGYNFTWQKDTVSVAEVLRQNGYGTAAFGKWHNTAPWEITPAGPFDHWPTSLGFEFFYGFHGGAENQFEPRIWRNTTPVEPKATPEQGYHFIADMADEATRWLRTQDAVYPDKPFFLWFAPGGTHWPQHVPADWIAKYQGKFDQGWDRLREQTFARQKQRGVIPASAELTPRPPELPAWDSLSADERRLLARQAEVSAAYLAYTDFQIGRVHQAISELGKTDNTLFIYIAGDNGAQITTPLLGRDAQGPDGRSLPLPERLKLLEAFGSDRFDNLYGGAWGWADNTPFQYGKGMPATLGGARNPMVVAWPARIRSHGQIRSQFSHVTDIAPTIFEATSIQPPEVVEGIQQVPFEGRSLLASFDDPKAVVAHTRQYFEMSGHRAIYQDGWWAGSRQVTQQPGNPFSVAPFGQRPWELYNLNEDYSQAHNLAERYPDKVKQLDALFDQEAWRNDVYPLLPDGRGRPNPANGRNVFTYRAGVQRIPSGNGPDVTRRAHRIEADIVVPAQGGDGVLIADGGRWGGFSLYIQNGRLSYAANAYGQVTGEIVASQPLPSGPLKVAFEFVPDALPANAAQVPTASGLTAQPPAPSAPSGIGRLFVNGQPVGEGPIRRIVYSAYESLDIGADLGTPVSPAYRTPFAYAGQLHQVRVELR
ncbi:MAG: arylsulfatase [Leptothrix sp. (in: b-proteobacteria)]